MRISRVLLFVLALTTSSASWGQVLADSSGSSPRSEVIGEQTSHKTTADIVADSANLRHRPKDRKTPKITFLILSGLTYAAVGMDMHDTTDSVSRCRRYGCLGDAEGNPIARPFTHLPAPAYYATGYALATGVNWLGWKMGESERWHKLWWLPQAVSISLNTHGIYTHHR